MRSSLVSKFAARQRFRPLSIIGGGLCLVVLLATSNLIADEPTDAAAARQADADYFETHIRPVLVEHCYECHSDQAAREDQLRGGLWVDSKQGLLEGGDSGPAVVPAEPDNSLLLAAMKYETYEMPPSGRLSDEVIQHFQTWIERGAYDPRTDASRTPAPSQIDLDAGRQHWAYQPIPETVGGSIDYWVDHQLQHAAPEHSEFEKLPRADRWTLARRLAIDLTGLPPTPQQLDAFINDHSPRAYEAMVDR